MTQDTTNHTPRRTFRLPAEEWKAFQAACDAAGQPAADVIRELVRRYTKRAGRTIE